MLIITFVAPCAAAFTAMTVPLITLSSPAGLPPADATNVPLVLGISGGGALVFALILLAAQVRTRRTLREHAEAKKRAARCAALSKCRGSGI
ncbi:MAG: hypothetical protein JWL94_2058 [Microbacteriaceae bacterium]|jgi:hypothetical protein|nr:hypothetical protein [Microbacteriaceae bacterium]